MLSTDGTYSRPRAVRNGHGFSVQEHLMRIAEGTAGPQPGNSIRASTPRTPAVVYTATDVTPPSVSIGAAEKRPAPAHEENNQDTSNAAV